jgi:hypothetical protein
MNPTSAAAPLFLWRFDLPRTGEFIGGIEMRINPPKEDCPREWTGPDA